jgi:tripartite-type tricarboxylate transporter receptor subunit TctC
MTKVTRRATLAAPILLAPGAARAQWAPSRPVTFLVGFAAGGVIDLVARALAQSLSGILGQNVVVENRTGAAGTIATTAMLRAPADGHTIAFSAIHMATNPHLLPVDYETARDIDMVAQTGSVPVLFLASAASEIRSVADAVAAMRAGDVPFASGGVGTSAHLAAELFARRLGVRYTHVPFRGGAPSLQAVMSGNPPLSFTVAAEGAFGAIRGGRIRGLAVMQDTRLEVMPDMPTIVEAGCGPELFISSWHGVMMRTGLPPEIRARWFAAINSAVASEGVRETMRRSGVEPRTTTDTQAFNRFVAAEFARWGEVIRAAGISAS